MLSVAEALERVLQPFAPLAREFVALPQGLGRVLCESLTARVTQPPAAVSAMDGYAVRAADVAQVPVTLRVVGTLPAGQVRDLPLGPGEALRIFTGAPLPPGADAVVIQEDTLAGEGIVEVRESVAPGRFVRAAGLDFRAGEALLPSGRRLTARDVALAAAMNRPWLPVHRRPRVAVLSSGDEVVMPGEPLGPGQILGSNGLGLAAFLAAEGAEAVNLGIAPDRADALASQAAGAAGADLLVTTGGASVGEHDLVRSALATQGLVLDFWKIAMRPGKPVIFGRLGATPLLGLPGNPVSTLVCALLFLRPILRRLQGLTPETPPLVARSAIALGENDRRQDYLRSRLWRDDAGQLWAEPFARQDSSMLATLARADGLVVRAPLAPPLAKGAAVPVIPFEGSAFSA